MIHWHKMSVFGLNRRERAILGVLETPRNITDVSNVLKIPRATATYTINKLTKRKLARAILHRKRKKYVTLSDTEAANLLWRAIDRIGTGAADVQGARVKTSREGEFLIYVGTRAMNQALERAIISHAGGRLRGIQPNKSWMSLHDKELKNVRRLNDAIKKHSIIVEGIIQQNAYQEYAAFFQNKRLLHAMMESFHGRMADYVAIDESYFNENAEMMIYEDVAFITNWKEEVTIEIRNPDIVGFLKEMFDIIKLAGHKIDHNKEMRNLRTAKNP